MWNGNRYPKFLDSRISESALVSEMHGYDCAIADVVDQLEQFIANIVSVYDSRDEFIDGTRGDREFNTYVFLTNFFKETR